MAELERGETDSIDYNEILEKISSTKALPSRTLLQYLIDKTTAVKSAEIQQNLNMSPQSVTNIGARLEELDLIIRKKGTYKVKMGKIINLLLDAIIDTKLQLKEMESEK